MKYPNSLEVLLLTLFFLNGSMEVFGQNYSSSENFKLQFDSNLEQVDVKKKSGFDGKVRAIRFNIEPENIHFLHEEQEEIDKNYPSESKPFNTNDQSSFLINDEKIKTMGTPKATTSRRLLQSNEKRRSSNVTKFLEPESLIMESLKTKRSIEKKASNNELHDLQTEEAKVFRPLFVYRQQVAKRLKLKNDKRTAGSGKNPRENQIPNNYYYHPVPYYYQRYFYNPYDKVYY